MQAYVIPLLFGFWHGLLFALLLSWRSWRQDRYSDRLLAACLIAGSLILLPYVLGFSGNQIMWTSLLFFPVDPGLLIGPLIWFYIRAQTDAGFRIRRKHLIHFLPIGIYVLYHLIVFSQGQRAVLDWLDRYDLPYINPVMQGLTLLSNYIYLFLAWRHYRQYRQWIEKEYVDDEPLRFGWYLGFVWSMAIGITAIWAFSALEITGLDLDYTQSWWPLLVVSIVIYYLGIAGYLNPQPAGIAFTRQREAEIKAIPEPEPDEEIAEVNSRILSLMDEEQIWRQSGLSLGDVASRTGSSRALVSASINQMHYRNFNQFVNRYRVEAFKREVSNPSNRDLTLLGIALNCGFNSKATFNRVFKEVTGQTPKSFVRELEVSPKDSNQAL